MEKLLHTLVQAWCWLRVVAAPFLIGCGLAAAAYYWIDEALGLVLAMLLPPLGLYLGVRMANYARRKGQLVEFAHGLPPSNEPPTDTKGDE